MVVSRNGLQVNQKLQGTPSSRTPWQGSPCRAAVSYCRPLTDSDMIEECFPIRTLRCCRGEWKSRLYQKGVFAYASPSTKCPRDETSGKFGLQCRPEAGK